MIIYHLPSILFLPSPILCCCCCRRPISPYTTFDSQFIQVYFSEYRTSSQSLIHELFSRTHETQRSKIKKFSVFNSFTLLQVGVKGLADSIGGCFNGHTKNGNLTTQALNQCSCFGMVLKSDEVR